MEPHKAPLQWISKEYYELNGNHVEILHHPPSPVEFSRLAHISRPVIIKGFQIPAYKLWSTEYLVQRMGSQKISIAVTPNGFADAIVAGPGDKLYFAEPLVEQMTMSDFLSKLSSVSHSEVYYLQSQNGNIHSKYDSLSDSNGDIAPKVSEFGALKRDVPSDVSWCSKAFGKSPDAVNLWIGDSRSVTSFHNDPYENIYTVVRGAKHFTLLPPTEGWCLKERLYPHATYKRSSTSTLMLETSRSTNNIRWSSILNPHLPGSLHPDAHPIHITLRPGDTLYLPVGWWHHVRQSEDLTIALNWWYDLEMRGMTWVFLSFLRGVEDVPSGNEDSGKGRDKITSLVEEPPSNL
ncbi:cupin-like domain-containing protein [Collybia nuda]|uniref:Cupin-like domain-containing protein n=1 Tax=Collybia nuda TaxID=64659 RepID=A0A9P6CJ94_9AGAR|nr:cupin-like domain-containing protein [Collybia nuda]